MHKALITLLGFIINLAVSVSPDLVIEINRHGGRGPLLNTYDFNNQWGSNISQITENGRRMGYLLGRAYQKDYPELLSSYDPQKIYVRSSEVKRTYETAGSILSGIYNGSLVGTDYPENFGLPPYNQTKIDEIRAELTNRTVSLGSVPNITIHQVPGADDVVIKNNDAAACPAAMLMLIEDVVSSQTSQVYETYMQDLVQYLRIQNITINSFIKLLYFGDTVISNYYANLTIPAKIKPHSKYYRDAEFAYNWMTANEYIGQQVQRQVNAVYLFKSIVNIMNRTIAGTSPLQFVIYSGHDNTLLSILSAFGLVTTECLLENYVTQSAGFQVPYEHCIYPAFASNLKFELYNGTTPTVKFYYNDDEIHLCVNATNGCTFSQFQDYIGQATNNYTTADYDRICSRPQGVANFDDTASNSNATASAQH